MRFCLKTNLAGGLGREVDGIETLVFNCSVLLNQPFHVGVNGVSNSRTWAPIIVFHQSWQAIRGTVCIEISVLNRSETDTYLCWRPR